MNKFIVYGLGISGISTAKALAQKNFEIIATDDNQVVIDQNIQKYPEINFLINLNLESPYFNNKRLLKFGR